MRAARGTYARSIRAHLQAIGAEDLPRNGAFILFRLYEASEPRDDLPAGLGVSKQAVSQAIDVLVNRGYVSRGADPSDRRRITLELTERGHEVVAAVWRGTEAIDSQLAARVSPEGVEAMRSGLMALADINAEATASGAGVPRSSRRSRQFRQFSPIFPVRDLAAALSHYATLGFKTFAYEGGGDYGFANRDRLSIHLTLDPGHEPGAAYLDVRDTDALYEEWSKPGVGGLTRPVEPMEYGLREGSHIDPDGNLIRFGSPDEEVE
jgi:DNA-binding MarR family transcriptional regulator/catechol 2,3-dioxygenase-like lactoylglutathione lyase family enzyme